MLLAIAEEACEGSGYALLAAAIGETVAIMRNATILPPGLANT